MVSLKITMIQCFYIKKSKKAKKCSLKLEDKNFITKKVAKTDRKGKRRITWL